MISNQDKTIKKSQKYFLNIDASLEPKNDGDIERSQFYKNDIQNHNNQMANKIIEKEHNSLRTLSPQKEEDKDTSQSKIHQTNTNQIDVYFQVNQLSYKKAQEVDISSNQNSYPIQQLYVDEKEDSNQLVVELNQNHNQNVGNQLFQESFEKEQSDSNNPNNQPLIIKKENQFYNQVMDHIIHIKNKLKQKDFDLTSFLTVGGEGVIYNGNQIQGGIKKEVVFKISNNYENNAVEGEVKIMKPLKNNIHFIGQIDYIEIDNFCIQILEKCLYNLNDELQLILNKKMEFPLSKLLKMIFDLLDGLNQLRIFTIIHLDIKPSNILVTQQGNYVYADFGISEKLKQQQNIQASGYTEKYAPIEQKNNTAFVNYRSDVYSLGKTLKEIISVFEIENPIDNSIINSYKKIIDTYMLQEQNFKREECQQLHERFFKEIKNSQYSEFLHSYYQSIAQSIHLRPYDTEKDNPFFTKLKIYYLSVQLSIAKLQNYDQQNIAIMLYQISNNYENLGDFEKALQYAFQSLDIFKSLYVKNLSFKTPIIATLSNIGFYYFTLGDMQLALQYSKESIEMDGQNSLRDDELSVQSISCIKYIYLALGDLLSALEFAKKQLNIYQKLYKENHIYVVNSMVSIYKIYIELGDLQQGKIILQKIFNTNDLIIEGIHPQIAYYYENIGFVCYQMNEFKGAIRYLDKSLAVKKQLYQENHLEIAVTMAFISLMYYYQGQFEKGLQIALDSEKIFKINAQGDYKYNHQRASNINNIGLFYCQMGYYQKGLTYLLDSVKLIKTIAQGNHPKLALYLSNISSNYLDMGDLQNALDYATQSIDIQRQIQKQNNNDLAESLLILSEIHKKQGKYQDAILEAVESLNIFQKYFQKNHPKIKKILFTISQLQLANQNIPEALNYYFKYQIMNEQLNQKNNEYTLDIPFTLNEIGFNSQEQTNKTNSQQSVPTK